MHIEWDPKVLKDLSPELLAKIQKTRFFDALDGAKKADWKGRVKNAGAGKRPIHKVVDVRGRAGYGADMVIQIENRNGEARVVFSMGGKMFGNAKSFQNLNDVVREAEMVFLEVTKQRVDTTGK